MGTEDVTMNKRKKGVGVNWKNGIVKILTDLGRGDLPLPALEKW